MEVVAFFVLLGIALLFGLLSLELDVHEFRLRLSGRMSFDQIEERTGWTRKKVQEVLGPMPKTHAYPIDRETLKKLPRNVWVAGPDIPLLNLVSVGGLVWAGVHSIITGVPEWALLGILGGYQAFSSAWEIVVIILRERSKNEDEEGIQEDPSTVADLEDAVVRAREEIQRDMRKEAVQKDDSPLWAWVTRRFNRWLLWKVDRVERRAAGLGAEYTRLAARHRELLTKVRWEIMRAERDGKSERAGELRKIESEISRDLEHGRRLAGR